MHRDVAPLARDKENPLPLRISCMTAEHPRFQRWTRIERSIQAELVYGALHRCNSIQVSTSSYQARNNGTGKIIFTAPNKHVAGCHAPRTIWPLARRRHRGSKREGRGAFARSVRPSKQGQHSSRDIARPVPIGNYGANIAFPKQTGPELTL